MSVTATQTASRVRSGETRALDVATAALAAATKEKANLNSYITLLNDSALKQAEHIDARIKKGETVGPLAGVPIAIKDNMMIKGARTTCASKILGDYMAPYDATVITKLRAAGAIFIGKTNMDEFAMGSSTEHSSFGGARNPWNRDLIPGGSSGGSAITVAARTVPLSLGSDTGGSIRQPASLCGVLGLKPTYGRVSRFGLVAFASSLDQIGPFATTVEDMALVMNVLCGLDPNDSTSVNEPVPDFKASLNQNLKGLRVGVPKEYFVQGMDPQVEKAVKTAIDVLKDEGATIVPISLPNSAAALAVYYIIAPAEASSNLARFDGIRFGPRSKAAQNLFEEYAFSRSEGFGPEVKRRILIGVYALSSGYYDAYYAKAQRVRTLIKRDFEAAFASVDAIATPVAPTPAFKLGEKLNDPLTMYLSDIFTIPANLAGIPGLSVPCGFSDDQRPIGLQLYAAPFKEATLFRVADAYLKKTGWNAKSPTF